MRKFITSTIAIGALLSTTAFGASHKCEFMPKNDLAAKRSTLRDATGITEAQFNSVIDKVEALYKPMIQDFGGKFKVNRLWSDETVNASAEQIGDDWVVNMYGGLARRPEVTEDGFAMVVCHELGHHIGGYPYVQDWAADEGQSDYYATMACAAKVFATNAELSLTANTSLPAALKEKCDNTYPSDSGRDLCYRSIVAGKSLADLLSKLGGTVANYDTPDTSVVTRTNHKHPAGQCRLDTYIAGALCGSEKWDYSLIPGKSLDHNSVEAQNEAYAHSCAEGLGARSKCWFAELNGDTPQPTECPFGDQAICDLLCQFDPSQPFCN